jgi:hypothetical protein
MLGITNFTRVPLRLITFTGFFCALFSVLISLIYLAYKLMYWDRFSAGVTGNVEVVQAQEAVATATENYLSALYSHNLAKISLARATGLSEERASRLLGGK